MVCPGDYVYVDWLRTSETASERMANKLRSKLLPKPIKPFRIINTMSHTITMYGDDIPNVVSIDRAMLALRQRNAPLVKQSTQKADTVHIKAPGDKKLRQPSEKPFKAYKGLCVALTSISSVISSVTSTQEMA